VANYIFPVRDYSDKNSASLSVLEFSDLPWKPERIYWLQDFKHEISRGNHAHKELSQVLIMVNGSLTLDLYQGKTHERIFFSRDMGQILLQPGTWRVITSASEDAILLVAASHPFSEDDYIRDWDEYLTWHLRISSDE
jgi:hypothetical protein